MNMYSKEIKFAIHIANFAAKVGRKKKKKTMVNTREGSLRDIHVTLPYGLFYCIHVQV